LLDKHVAYLKIRFATPFFTLFSLQFQMRWIKCHVFIHQAAYNILKNCRQKKLILILDFKIVSRCRSNTCLRNREGEKNPADEIIAMMEIVKFKSPNLLTVTVNNYKSLVFNIYIVLMKTAGWQPLLKLFILLFVKQAAQHATATV